ncbi:MAG: MerR family transcriptional regulator [Acidimicrobiales bacterium]
MIASATEFKQEGNQALVSIGRAAARLGVSERTLRYYEEIGLLAPVDHTPGRIRRYSEAEMARVGRIKELRDLMGFNLDEIRSILGNEDRLQELREEYRAGVAGPRRAALLGECLDLQEDLRAKVVAKAALLGDFLAELDARIAKTRAVACVGE